MKNAVLTLIISLVALFAMANLSLANSPPFSDMTYDQAVEAAAAQSKPLLLYVRSRSSGPCKHMERTTWANPVLIDWIDANAIAIMLDNTRLRKLRGKLGLDTTPEVLLFLDRGNPIRRTGYTDAATILRDVGEEELAKESEPHHAAQHEWRVDMTKPLNKYSLATKARTLTDEEDYETALAAYVWIWKRDTALSKGFGNRAGYLRGEDLNKLASRFPPAMLQFQIFRNDIERRLIQGNASFDDFSDWLMLNEAVDEPESTISWILRIRGTDRFKASFERTAHQIQESMIGWNQWKLFGEIHPNPVESVRQSVTFSLQMARQAAQQAANNDQEDDRQRELMADSIRLIDETVFQDASEIYAACLAAHRDREAREIEKIFHQLDTDGSLHVMMVRHALKAGALQERHLLMLDQAKKMGTDRSGLRKLVEQMLGVVSDDADAA